MSDILIRFIVGGLVVSCFSTLADILRPKSFAGLLGAAPSVALATLALTIRHDGKVYAATEARQHRETIRRIVRESGMDNPRLYGSALHGDDIAGSDLDILVDAPPGTSLFDVVNLQLALEDALSIKIDVRTPDELHRAFRESVLAEATSI